MNRFALPALALSALLLVGCAEESVTPLASDHPLFGNGNGNGGGGGTTSEETDPMTIWDWQSTLSDNTTAALITGDGRTVVSAGNETLVSSTTTGAYEGGLCGVRAKIFWSGTNYGGDAVFDADIEPNDGTCPARFIRFDLDPISTTNSLLSDAPYMNVRQIMYTHLNTPRQQTIRLNHLSNIPNCERIEFGTPTADPNDDPYLAESGGVKVTRIAGAYATRGGGKWIVETVDHQGTCYYRAKGKDKQGATYTLPFRIIVTELASLGS